MKKTLIGIMALLSVSAFANTSIELNCSTDRNEHISGFFSDKPLTVKLEVNKDGLIKTGSLSCLHDEHGEVTVMASDSRLCLGQKFYTNTISNCVSFKENSLKELEVGSLIKTEYYYNSNHGFYELELPCYRTK